MARKTKKPQPGSVRVRMYDVGFGDAFLVLIPTKDGERRVLIDCGSVAKSNTPMADIVEAIIEDIKDADGKARIDVVIASHRHKDHVSGFASDAWKDISVGEVWMPWTENPKDKEAKRIRDKQTKLALSLQNSLQLRLGIAQTPDDIADDPDAHPAYRMTLNALPNESAMRTLHEGFAGDPERKFFPDENNARIYRTDMLPDVVVHILGPSKDEDVIRDIDPPSGDSYLRASAEMPGPVKTTLTAPFGSKWALPPDEFSTSEEWKHLSLTDADIAKLEKVTADPESALAATLDKAINGTSLMLIFEIGKTFLLFPGDAQWGTWMRVLADQEWRELLARTNFFKVGHHGSHNATPPEFVEKLFPNDTWAMVSTRPVKQWPDIPRVPLLEALEHKHTKLARSDRPDEAPAGSVPAGKAYTEAVIDL